MALAPYWLMPTLCPLPVPVMVKVPLLEDVGFTLPPLVVDTPEIPEEEMTLALFPSILETLPLPEMTDMPSSPSSVVLPLTTTPLVPDGPPPLMAKRRLFTDFLKVLL